MRRKMLKGEKESFSWSSGSAPQKSRYSEYRTMGINRVSMRKGVLLHLSLAIL